MILFLTVFDAFSERTLEGADKFIELDFSKHNFGVIAYVLGNKNV